MTSPPALPSSRSSAPSEHVILALPALAVSAVMLFLAQDFIQFGGLCGWRPFPSWLSLREMRAFPTFGADLPRVVSGGLNMWHYLSQNRRDVYYCGAVHPDTSCLHFRLSRAAGSTIRAPRCLVARIFCPAGSLGGVRIPRRSDIAPQHMGKPGLHTDELLAGAAGCLARRDLGDQFLRPSSARDHCGLAMQARHRIPKDEVGCHDRLIPCGRDGVWLLAVASNSEAAVFREGRATFPPAI